MNPPPPAPPSTPPSPPSPPSPKPISFLVVLGITAAILAGMAIFAAVGFLLWYGGPSRSAPTTQSTPATPPPPRLGSHYAGELSWKGQTVRIRWRDRGTLDNDNDHLVVAIEGEGVAVQAVWGWMESGLGRVGARAEVLRKDLKMPPGWPQPSGLVINQPLPNGGWAGELHAADGPILIKLDPP